MTDYKLEAAIAASALITDGQTIGLGAGTTIAHLVRIIHEDPTPVTLTFTSSSFETNQLLKRYGLTVVPPSSLKKTDIYFDGCDQFDPELNALKSGAGIHTTEKILASMADEFILLGDAGKFVPQLNYTLVVEIIPQALQVVQERLTVDFPDASLLLRMNKEEEGAVVSAYGNFLLDIKFTKMPALAALNTHIKMIPGVVDHSLFYRMATKAIIAGKEGIQVILPLY